ncbi:MAG: hypothetical protein M3O30_11415 [Planctomycetota bacterium]|nr:hypothetical protein [Planctomycetota bacterium]
MHPDPLPQELIDLENQLRARPISSPTAGLRDRILRAAAESASPPQSTPAGQWTSGYWAAAAATVLIVMNLSMISASPNEFAIAPAPSPDQIAAELQALHQFETQQEGQFK